MLLHPSQQFLPTTTAPDAGKMSPVCVSITECQSVSIIITSHPIAVLAPISILFTQMTLVSKLLTMPSPSFKTPVLATEILQPLQKVTHPLNSMHPSISSTALEKILSSIPEHEKPILNILERYPHFADTAPFNEFKTQLYLTKTGIFKAFLQPHNFPET